jgi:RHS repeat-associated protein
VNQFTFDGATNHITSGGITYDAVGNMTYDGFHTYTYDAESRLKQVDSGSTAKYNYDSFGNRSMQYAPPVYNEYVVDLSGRAITAVKPGTSTVYTAEVNAGGRHWVTDNGSALFIGPDWVGTSRALTNLSGTFDQLYSSLPWGDGLSFAGGSSLHTTSQYTGKEYDNESNLYHFPARQYAPVQGRWLTPDPGGVAVMDVSNPQTWNRYAYVNNNPMSSVDPTGLLDDPACKVNDIGCGGAGAGGMDSGGMGGWDAGYGGGRGGDGIEECGVNIYCIQSGGYGPFGSPVAHGFSWSDSVITSTSGSNGFAMVLKVSFWAPWVGTCPVDEFCGGNLSYNEFQFTDPAEHKDFAFNISFDNTVAAFGRRGIEPSEWDNKYNPLHDYNLRDSNTYCSFHVDLNSKGGMPTTGSIHIDGINPNISLTDRLLHGAGDLLPDFLRKIGLPVPGAASNCVR